MRVTTIAITIGIWGALGFLGAPAGQVPRAYGQAPAEHPGDKPPGAPAATGKPTKVEYSDHAMGTNVNVWLWTADEAGAAKAAAAVFAEMRRLDNEMTNWDPKPGEPPSEVWQINAAAGGKPVKVSDETFAVIARALDISKRSRGLFDITVGALPVRVRA